MGRPDIFFANGANIETLKKDDAKYANRLLRNDGKGVFTDVTKEAGLIGKGYDNGVAVGDYDNDGFPDFVCRGSARQHAVSQQWKRNVYGCDGKGRPGSVPRCEIWAVMVDGRGMGRCNNDGLLDLFVVNYMQWDVKTEHLCGPSTGYDYCTPKFYEGQPNQLFLNRGDGTFEDVSEKMGDSRIGWQGHGRRSSGFRWGWTSGFVRDERYFR